MCLQLINNRNQFPKLSMNRKFLKLRLLWLLFPLLLTACADEEENISEFATKEFSGSGISVTSKFEMPSALYSFTICILRTTDTGSICTESTVNEASSDASTDSFIVDLKDTESVNTINIANLNINHSYFTTSHYVEPTSDYLIDINVGTNNIGVWSVKIEQP